MFHQGCKSSCVSCDHEVFLVHFCLILLKYNHMIYSIDRQMGTHDWVDSIRFPYLGGIPSHRPYIDLIYGIGTSNSGSLFAVPVGRSGTLQELFKKERLSGLERQVVWASQTWPVGPVDLTKYRPCTLYLTTASKPKNMGMSIYIYISG